ncbi:MAG: hypothetical protein QM489_07530 [Candidatus Izemoplasma sp.]
MSKYYYDLHIHSILSPCADILMTPNNILNMAMLKGLDFISITDHNSVKQLPIMKELALSYDFVFVPGIEVTVKEDFDVLCYFKTLNLALEFGNVIESYLTDDWHGYTKENQVITDIYDQDETYYSKSLVKTNIAFKELQQLVNTFDGLLVLAHIDRLESSVLNTYKLDEITFDGIELQKKHLLRTKLLKEYDNYRILINSDAHDLYTISEKDSYFLLEEKTIDAFFNYMRSNNE